MSKGYRGIVLAAFGWLILCGLAPEKVAVGAQDKGTTSRQTIPSPPVEASEYERPCEQDKENRRSDLCAQWKAADATADNVFWAKLQFWVGLAGVAGLLVSLYLTRKAILLTAESTKSAQKSADAAVAAVHSERAWLTVANVETVPAKNVNLDGQQQEEALMFMMHWKNTGRSPGIVAWSIVSHQVGPRGSPPPVFNLPTPALDDSLNRTTVAPDVGFRSDERVLGHADMKDFMDQKTTLFIYGKIGYFDVFDNGRLRVTEACYMAQRNGSVSNNGAETPRLQIGAVGRQNSAT